MQVNLRHASNVVGTVATSCHFSEHTGGSLRYRRAGIVFFGGAKYIMEVFFNEFDGKHRCEITRQHGVGGQLGGGAAYRRCRDDFKDLCRVHVAAPLPIGPA